jgi:hypothetical protein
MVRWILIDGKRLENFERKEKKQIFKWIRLNYLKAKNILVMKKRIGLFRLNSKLYKDVSIKNENEWKKKIDIIHD